MCIVNTFHYNFRMHIHYVKISHETEILFPGKPQSFSVIFFLLLFASLYDFSRGFKTYSCVGCLDSRLKRSSGHLWGVWKYGLYLLETYLFFHQKKKKWKLGKIERNSSIDHSNPGWWLRPFITTLTLIQPTCISSQVHLGPKLTSKYIVRTFCTGWWRQKKMNSTISLLF